MEYKIRELTPRELQCVIASCPAIYLVDRTPKSSQCIIGGCEGIYEESSQGVYLIVGKTVDPKEFGLAEKVGKRETLISVPKDLIDKMQKE